MRIAVTGTPGVGKTSACSRVKGVRVVHVNELVDELGLASGYDRKRKTKEVDIVKLAKAVAALGDSILLEGHLSHLLKPDLAIVLRCSPRVLERRLRKKHWPSQKVRENVEAEAVDVVLIEAIENVPEVCEIDTTKMKPAQVARAIESILAGERQKYRVGNVDWSEEVLSWF
ncbi:MAG: adenylate kinase family protein [Candidatus Thermoplasmatota archaeon]|nr:adenylate kinase family protein [Candidatus Thermoplasmatota archaeon]